MALPLKDSASGILLKSEAPEGLERVIQFVANRKVCTDPKVIQMLGEKRRVLLGILGGLTNKRIGENLGRSESLLKNCEQRLFERPV